MIKRMTYQEIFHLKFEQGITTQELLRKYPDSMQKVEEVALVEVPAEILKEIVKEEDELRKILRLKKRFQKFLRPTSL